MGSCYSSPKVVDCAFEVQPMTPAMMKEADELIEQMVDKLVLDLKAKMPSCPSHKVA